MGAIALPSPDYLFSCRLNSGKNLILPNDSKLSFSSTPAGKKMLLSNILDKFLGLKHTGPAQVRSPALNPSLRLEDGICRFNQASASGYLKLASAQPTSWNKRRSRLPSKKTGVLLSEKGMNRFWEGIIAEVYHIYQLIKFYIFFLMNVQLSHETDEQLIWCNSIIGYLEQLHCSTIINTPVMNKLIAKFLCSSLFPLGWIPTSGISRWKDKYFRFLLFY